MEFIKEKMPVQEQGLGLIFTLKAKVSFSTSQYSPDAFLVSSFPLAKSRFKASFAHSDQEQELITSRLLLIHLFKQNPPLARRRRSSYTSRHRRSQDF